MAILGEIMPAFPGLYRMQVTALNARLGFNVEESLLSSLGDGLVSCDSFRPAERPGAGSSIEAIDEVYGLSVTDRQTLEMALEALKDTFAPGGEIFEEREYLDTVIHVLETPLPAETEGAPESFLAYALTDEYLFLSQGSTAGLETLLSRLKKPGRSIWQREEIRTAIERLPPGASALGVLDMASLVDGMFGAMVAVVDYAEPEEGVYWDREARPDLRYLRRKAGIAVSGMYKDGGSLSYTLRLFPPREP
jgi:hypothetical protein